MKTVIMNPNGDDNETKRTIIVLRACPFCGSSAVYESYGTTEYGDKCFSIGCASCGAKGPLYGHLGTTMDDAIDAWNVRRDVE